MERDVILSPSLLSADFSHLESELAVIKEKGGSMVHLDVMDGHFVPNLTFGAPLISCIRKRSDLIFDVHLMANNPADYVESFAKSGVDYFTFHIEAETHAHRLIEAVHNAGMKAGISLVPSTPVSAIQEVLSFVDLVLVMTVNPGFSGQKMIVSCLKKIKTLRELREQNQWNYKISVDGGVNQSNLSSVIDQGADVVVSGSSFFSGELTI